MKNWVIEYMENQHLQIGISILIPHHHSNQKRVLGQISRWTVEKLDHTVKLKPTPTDRDLPNNVHQASKTTKR